MTSFMPHISYHNKKEYIVKPVNISSIFTISYKHHHQLLPPPPEQVFHNTESGEMGSAEVHWMLGWPRIVFLHQELGEMGAAPRLLNPLE